MQPVKVLLVQLAANGDCLFVTTIAKQIREVDYPGCHLTWLIGSRCRQVIENNPYIDEIIEIPLSTSENVQKQRDAIHEHIAKLGGYNKYDKIFITDFIEENYKNWDGTTRASLFRSYPHKLKINPQPLIFLTTAEKSRVAEFCLKNKITKNTFNVLFECSPQSGQSRMTFQRAKKISEELTSRNANLKFILSSHQSFISENANVIDGSVISWRENAELANYCQLFVGCSSGISWLCTSNATNPIPFIQVINPLYMKGKFSASMKMDFMYFGIDTGKLIELYNPPDTILKECILAATTNNFEIVKRKFDVKENSIFLKYA